MKLRELGGSPARVESGHEPLFFLRRPANERIGRGVLGPAIGIRHGAIPFDRAYRFEKRPHGVRVLIGLSPSRRTPLYNGALECRLFEFKLVAGSMRKKRDGPV